ncbi:MAG TPA: hypothetical protein VLJ57_10215 [Burkholderiaceae bacterium]|nr:hypothetical protein [Burkholderiaceae bacterium]
MDAAQRIRASMSVVATLRSDRNTDRALDDAVLAVKRFQASRFEGTYADLLAGPPYQDAARFFLEELYGDKDFADRDAQFARIAGTMQKLFPEQVVATALALAELHALTEQLDHAMGQAWLAPDVADASSGARRYVLAWRLVDQRPMRESQLNVVLGIGRDLARLTRAPGLRLLLKMMRGPASAAGMGSLQRFLEAGFDTFGAMSRHRSGAEGFLNIIEGRESRLIAQWFDASLVACETELAQTLGQAR